MLPDEIGETPNETLCILDLAMCDDGHRGGYIAFLDKLFKTMRMPFGWHGAVTRLPVLVPMIEESFYKYVAVCMLRSLLGRITVGLMFRPGQALDGRSWRLRIKRWALAGLRNLRGTSTLTILPFAVEPRFSSIAVDWIYDFECWDFAGDCPLSERPMGPLGIEILRVADGRKVCCAVGRQDEAKGFDQFTKLYRSYPELREGFLFAFGGKVASDLAVSTADFVAMGGFAIPRFISDDELLDLYACADLIWCAYAADYDQASGVLGRAIQFGIPVVVRKDSLIHRLCIIEGVSHIALDDATDLIRFIRGAEKKERALAAERALLHRQESLRRLSSALGIHPRESVGIG